jgi:DNA polymerase III subunit alpha
MMPNGLPEQDEVNQQIITLSKKTGIPTLATNDCHYLSRQDARAHEILMCVQQKRTIKDEKRLQHTTDAYYLRSPGEMNELFKHWPQAMENAARLGEMCNVTFDLGKTYYLPQFKVPESSTPESHVAELSQRGLEARFTTFDKQNKPYDRAVYEARLALELGVIQSMNFSGYFLIVQDFINHAKEKGIPVGPGRGSGAGSLVAYALRITDIDPIPNKLLFERFLNPERVSMPDFDIDFCMNRRDEVIHYVTAKYGKDNVGQIVTMHQMKARSCIRDVARAMAIPVADANRIASMVPEPIQGKSPPLPEAIQQEPRLKEIYDAGGEYRDLLDTAMRLEGLNRHAGMHAAGVVIAEKPLWEYVPLFKPAGDDQIVTQFNMGDVEKAGLVKFDFLGLKTLTVIQTCLDLVNRVLGPEAAVDISAIPLDDIEVYKMLTAADVTGVFQVESSGFRELLKKLKPDCFEDIVAAGALYRPGPLEGGMVDDFIERKHGRQKIEYDHPLLEPILKDTYGVIVYQEQVMQISSALAGYSLGRADLLRRAMGKKKAEVMAKEKAGFLEGAKEKGVDPAIAERVFDLMEKFAAYGFNRSHSAAYGLLTWQTGFLKRHHPVEFFAGLLTCDKDDTDAIVKFIAEARSQGIPVLRPDVNESDANFTVVSDGVTEATPEGTAGAAGAATAAKGKAKGAARATSALGKAIRFGLAAVKGVGEGAVEIIQAARKTGGPFLSMTDFCIRVDARKVNRKVLEALVKSGAFDGIAQKNGVTRARIFTAITAAMERATATQRERESGQTSLLSLLGGGSAKNPAPEPVDDAYDANMEEWLPRELLSNEKESLGFYISGHPLDRFAGELRRFANCQTSTCMERGPGAEVTLGGVVCDYQERMAKSGSGKYAFFKLEDQLGQVEFMVGNARLGEYRDALTSNEPLLVSGTVDAPFGEGEAVRERLRFLSARPLAALRSERSSLMDIRLNAEAVTEDGLRSLEKLLRQFPGPCRTQLHLEIPKRSEAILQLPEEYKVVASDELLARIELLFGEKVAFLR